MKPERVVTRQRVEPSKLQLAKEMRRSPTPEEGLLWQRLRRSQLDGLHFRRQQVIDGFIVDFYCHRAGVVVEVDGPIHMQSADYDRERDRVLAEHGLRVLRVSTSEVSSNMRGVLGEIAQAARAAIEQSTSDEAPLPLREGVGG